MRMAGKNHLVGYFDAPADKPTVVEFVDHLEAAQHHPDPPLRSGTFAKTVHKVGCRQVRGTGAGGAVGGGGRAAARRLAAARAIAASSATCRRSRRRPATGGKRVEVVSKDPEADAERILRNFVRRAFRRAVTDDDVKPFLNLVKAKLAEKQSFEQAVRVGLMARAGVAGVPVPPREARQARRLRPGQPAVVLPVEHDARRGVAHPGRAEAS